MRLASVNRSDNLKGKLLILLIGLLERRRVPDSLRVLLYAPRHFGNRFRAWVHAVCRGEGALSVGERELVGAWVSRLNRCPY